MAFEAITTQEQLDAIVNERVEQEVGKYAGFEDFKKKAEDYDALKKESDGYKETIAGLNKAIEGDEKTPGYKKQIEALRGKVKGYETDSVKLKVAHEHGIPYELAGRLNGEDEAAITKDAEIMAKYLKGRSVAPLASTEPETVNSKTAAVKSLLSGLKGE